MMNFRGKIMKGGRVLCDHVVGVISADADSWAGDFLLPPNQVLYAGGYSLELDDGRSGGIVLAGVAIGDSASVAFRGSGPLS
jgi:hypothetical protein